MKTKARRRVRGGKGLEWLTQLSRMKRSWNYLKVFL